jgi:N-acetylneuraminate synthase
LEYFVTSIKLGSRRIAWDAPCFVIAEVAQSHEGSLGQAHAIIDAVADGGADAVKFQTHIADAESTRDEPWRVAFSEQDAGRFDYWKRMEFTAEQWAGLHEHAARRKLTFLSSAFSIQAVEMLERVGVPAWKVGSGEIHSKDLLDAMIKTGKPILLSTGLSTWADIAAVVERLKEANVGCGLFQCTSKYPSPIEEVGLNIIKEMRNRFDCPVGLSDHTGRIEPSLTAVARGFDMLEVHVTFDRRMFGPDVKASLTFAELKQVVDLRDACALMDANPVDKVVLAADIAATRDIFTKSLAPRHFLAAGTVLTADMLVAKKPGTGIPAAAIEKLVGRELARDVQPDRLLRPDDLCGGL